MTTNLFDDDPVRDAEAVAAQWADEFSAGYVGRRRHPDDVVLIWLETAVEPTVCPNPAGHYQLERSAAQELRMPSLAAAEECPWCGLPYQLREA